MSIGSQSSRLDALLGRQETGGREVDADDQVAVQLLVVQIHRQCAVTGPGDGAQRLEGFLLAFRQRRRPLRRSSEGERDGNSGGCRAEDSRPEAGARFGWCRCWARLAWEPRGLEGRRGPSPGPYGLGPGASGSRSGPSWTRAARPRSGRRAAARSRFGPPARSFGPRDCRAWSARPACRGIPRCICRTTAQ